MSVELSLELEGIHRVVVLVDGGLVGSEEVVEGGDVAVEVFSEQSGLLGGQGHSHRVEVVLHFAAE